MEYSSEENSYGLWENIFYGLLEVINGILKLKFQHECGGICNAEVIRSEGDKSG